MISLSAEHLQSLISNYGYLAVGTIICLESMGLPLPGETVLVVAALYAGRHPDMSIWGVTASAAIGAILGDNIGYWLGCEFGYRLLLRYGSYIGVSEGRIKLGQYLFQRHGGKVVFFGRFVAVLRVLAAFLAGVNRMAWRRFLIANGAGAMVWATVYGVAAFSLGRVLLQVKGPVAAVLGLIAIVVLVLAAMYLRKHEAQLEAEAERAIPGPLRPLHHVRARKNTDGGT